MRPFAAALALAVAVATLAPSVSASVRDLNTVKEGDTIPAFKGRSLTGERSTSARSSARR